ncbi:hypothetical protein CCP3SC15_4350002 [Gammaproteobacteria bacterium]
MEPDELAELELVPGSGDYILAKLIRSAIQDATSNKVAKHSGSLPTRTDKVHARNWLRNEAPVILAQLGYDVELFTARIDRLLK